MGLTETVAPSFSNPLDPAQRKIGADRMHVTLVGEMRKKPQYDEHEARWRLWNIVVPACALFDATVALVPDWLYAALGILLTPYVMGIPIFAMALFELASTRLTSPPS